MSRRKTAKGEHHIRRECRTCFNLTAKRSRDRIAAADPVQAAHRNWKRNLWRSYRMTPEAWQKLHDAQGGVCMYCGRGETGRYLRGGVELVKRLSVDHDHACCPHHSRTCGACVRGLTCQQCNYLLGQVENNLDLLQRMNEVHRWNL